MAVFEVYRHPEFRRYRTSLCSRATIFVFVLYILTIFGPLLVAFRSQGFWQRTDTYFEQPLVKYKHKVLAIVDTVNQTSGLASYLVWSTYQNLNLLMQSRMRIPLVESYEEDINRDGLNDALHFTLSLPLYDYESVHGVKLLLFFDYQLQAMSLVTMESMAYINYEAFLPGGQLMTQGVLRLQQTAPVLHTGTNQLYSRSIIDDTSVFPEDYNVSNILQTYLSRNLTTWYDSKYPVWLPGRGNGQPFVVKVTITYPTEQVLYYTGFWQLIKWAWVQYVSILVAFVFVLERLKVFVFSNQILTTIVERPTSVKAKSQ